MGMRKAHKFLPSELEPRADVKLTVPEDDLVDSELELELWGVKLRLRLGSTDEAKDEKALLDLDEGAKLDETMPLDAGEEELTGAEMLAAPDDVALAARLPIVLREVQRDDDGAGCAEGVTGSPWKNVEVP
jgi:hypothetical protein